MRQEVVKRQITENDNKRTHLSRVKPNEFEELTDNNNFAEWKNIFVLQMRVNDLEHTLHEDFEKLLDPDRPDPCDPMFMNYPPLYQLELTRDLHTIFIQMKRTSKRHVPIRGRCII